MKTQIKNTEIIGKYLNQYLWTDINPIGKVIGSRGKSIVIVQKVVADKQKTKLEWVVGGFAGHCVNQHAQKWEYELTDEIFEIRLSKKFLKRVGISDFPHKYYDYNF